MALGTQVSQDTEIFELGEFIKDDGLPSDCLLVENTAQ